MEFNLSTTAMFTGHRPQKFASQTDIEASKIAIKRMVKRAKELGYDTFISGMALGVDTWGAITVLDDPQLKLVCAVPCRNQESLWQWADQLRHQEILKFAHYVHYVCDGDYYNGCLEARNRWMVDHASLVLAVWDGRPGGTANCVNYARSLSRTGMIFNPHLATYSKL